MVTDENNYNKLCKIEPATEKKLCENSIFKFVRYIDVLTKIRYIGVRYIRVRYF